MCRRRIAFDPIDALVDRNRAQKKFQKKFAAQVMKFLCQTMGAVVPALAANPDPRGQATEARDGSSTLSLARSTPSSTMGA
jgi:hypothetical protein